MTDLIWLDNNDFQFPPLDQALLEPNGLLAAGGDLSPERLINAYRSGIFPWFEEDQPILWWSPNPRSVLKPGEIHTSKSLRKTIRKGVFQVTTDQAFEKVIYQCKDTREYTQGTWITDEMADAYISLHQLGTAHSVESWIDGNLVGGLYGIAIGRLFFGESMFSTVTDASKVAFEYLAARLNRAGFELIDCQVPNDHLKSLGSTEISRTKFQDYLEQYLDQTPNFDPWVND